MPSDKHSPEPWRVEHLIPGDETDQPSLWVVYDASNRLVAEFEREQDDRHAVKCVNACKGFDDPMDMRRYAEKAIDSEITELTGL